MPHRVSIRKSASYGFRWNRIGNCGGSGGVAPPMVLVKRSATVQASSESSEYFAIIVFP